MKISSYRAYKGENGVCITHYKPVNWKGESYTKLCPSSKLLLAYKRGKLTDEEFEKIYREDVLKNLDAREVYSDLKDKVLLTSDEKMFSFKYIVASWIEEELGVKVEKI